MKDFRLQMSLSDTLLSLQQGFIAKIKNPELGEAEMLELAGIEGHVFDGVGFAFSTLAPEDAEEITAVIATWKATLPDLCRSEVSNRFWAADDAERAANKLKRGPSYNELRQQPGSKYYRAGGQG